MPAFRRAEIWGDLAAAGGARLAAIPDLISLNETRRTSGDDELKLTLPVGSVSYAQVKERRVLRTVYVDDTFDEWRILGINESRSSDNGKVVDVSAASPLVDLSRTLVSRTEADGLVHFDFEGLQLTTTEHINSLILPALTADGITHFALGTIDPTWPVDQVYQWSTPLAALRQLADTTGCELRVRRNGTTNYLIDILTAIGSGAATVDFRIGKNIKGIARDRSSTEQATRVYPRGQVDEFGATMARAVWEVVSVAGSVVRLKDSAGGDGPAQFADQLNGTYLRKASGTLTLVSVTAVISTLLTDVTVADASSITGGDLLQFRKNAGGDDLTYLDAPAQKATYGLIAGLVDRPDIPATWNQGKNPSMRLWTGISTVPPDNWAKLGTPTLAKTTTAARWRVGGQSCRVQASSDGDGIEMNYVPAAPTAALPYFSGFISVWLESGGQVRVELVVNDGTNTYVLPDAVQKAFTSQTKIWVDLGVAGIDLLKLGATQVKIRVVQDGATATDFYVDAGQIGQWSQQQPYIEGSGGTKLWQAANDNLLLQADPLIRYDVDVLDLTRLNPGAWPNDDITLGGTVKVKDAGLGVDGTTRVLEIRRDLLIDASTAVVLSSRPEDLTDNLVAPRPKPRRDPDPGTDVGRLPEVLSITLTVNSGGSVLATVQGNRNTGSLRLVGRKDTYPNITQVRAQPAQPGRNVTEFTVIDDATGVAMVLGFNEICKLSVISYSGPPTVAGPPAGYEGPIANGAVRSPLVMRRSIFVANGNFTCPSDWNSGNNLIEGIGSGGSGVDGVINTRGGGGGGGGEYRAVKNVALTIGTTYPFTVVGNTTFNTSTLIAVAGATASGITGGAGGSGGTGAFANFNGAAGGNSANGSIQPGGGGGGAAGPAGAGAGQTAGGPADPWGTGQRAGGGGNAGTPPTPVNANPGSSFGGGGGGGACTAAARSLGASGAAGILVITWYA